MDTDHLVFDALPAMPQLHSLLPFATAAWERPEAVAIWIGGSIARGNSDRYSDVDITITVQEEALETWKQSWVTSLFDGKSVGYKAFPLGEQAFLHHVILSSGDIYDIVVRSSLHAELPKESIILLGCRDAEFAERLRHVKAEPATPCPPVSPAVVHELVTDFWVNTHKHRKVLNRGLHLMAQTGIEMERGLLTRLWHIEATGQDCGSTRHQTIFGMTQVMRTVEKARGAEALATLGASLGDRDAICRAIEKLRVEFAKVGRTLAATLGFDYPFELEGVVQQGWQEYMQS